MEVVHCVNPAPADILETLKRPVPALQPLLPNIKNAFPARCPTASTFRSRCRVWIMKSSAAIESANQAHQFASADLAGSEEIQSPHLAEALQYRPKIMMG